MDSDVFHSSARRSIHRKYGASHVAGQVETKGKASMGGEKSLYERLRGKKAITTVVDEFVANVAADARINKFFAATAADPNRMATFKGRLVDQVCQASGGPALTRANL